MPLHTQLNLAPARPLNIDDHTPSFAAYIRAAWDDARADNPGALTANMLEASERRYGFNVMDAAEAGGRPEDWNNWPKPNPFPPGTRKNSGTISKTKGWKASLPPTNTIRAPNSNFWRNSNMRKSNGN